MPVESQLSQAGAHIVTEYGGQRTVGRKVSEEPWIQPLRTGGYDHVVQIGQYRIKTFGLNGWRGWEFPHHLGHGIGMNPHESPRLNPNWDDHFAVGDVFTVEPGLYAPELAGGVRLEQNFVVTPSGVEAFSTFPLDL